MSPKQFWSKKLLCSKNLGETKFWANKLGLSKNFKVKNLSERQIENLKNSIKKSNFEII